MVQNFELVPLEVSDVSILDPAKITKQNKKILDCK